MAFASSQTEVPGQQLDRQFQSAVAQYDAGKFAQAAALLEALLPKTPKSYEVHELLGLVYAAESQNDKAVGQLEAAVHLKPNSAEARTNLAAALSHAGKPELAGDQLFKAHGASSRDYEANHNLGEFYVQTGKVAQAQPLLEEAQRLQPTSYDNGYDLAQTDLLIGKLPEARLVVQRLILEKNTGELHNLLGQIEEKDGKFVEAAKEFETAARLDPSEDNLFAWGSELLLHRTYGPAIEVFQQATERYPSSPRLRIGLGMALYWRGKYEEAVRSLLAAADLDPSDARCYLFLAKAYDSSPNQAADVIERFRRYAELQPSNGLAQYYYAMSLWKGKGAEEANPEHAQIESLLQKAVALDPKLAEAHLQLGILYTQGHESEKALPEYTQALQVDPKLADAHYRLAQYYVHVGQKSQASTEFDVYQRLRAEHLAEVDKEATEVQQFVYSAKAAPPAK
ncbi:TPR repeat [Acidisarcina polymorpha]|uniref:TPR repeat n=1 Tax=Acidisarcina polymorpha TaxID=2211140 RepID=A0A2Z5FY36_9BACT|nr:tetratricopeptide repeat protein [Acidisarcina polymorpha]AXC11286.1 TPR repeat [Acidisarcina polymorpha]